MKPGDATDLLLYSRMEQINNKHKHHEFRTHLQRAVTQGSGPRLQGEMP